MATLDYGATLASSTTDGSYTTHAGIIDIEEAEDVLSMIKLSILANTTHKKMGGTFELGDIPVMIEFAKTLYNTLHGYFTSKADRWWQITDADGNIWKGQAMISRWKKPKFRASGDGDRLTYNITLTPTQANWTFTAV